MDILFSPANQLATPPSLGIMEVISARALAALPAAIKFSGTTPTIASEKPLSPPPRDIKSPANLDILFSPANQLTTPPSLGIVAVISASALAALEAAIKFSGTIPTIASENPLSPWPSAMRSKPNLDILFSPANQLATPPSLGIVAVISASALAALAAAIMFSGTIPDTESEKPLRPLPNTGSCGANLAMLLSPANQLATPPSLGIIEAISASDLAASAEALIASVSTPATESEYAFNDGPKAAISSPNLAKDDPPVTQEVKRSRRLAPVSAKIVPTRAFTPLSVS